MFKIGDCITYRGNPGIVVALQPTPHGITYGTPYVRVQLAGELSPRNVSPDDLTITPDFAQGGTATALTEPDPQDTREGCLHRACFCHVDPHPLGFRCSHCGCHVVAEETPW